ncbi:MAG: hypothetical protein G3M78_10740 [Candidatus Nitrohelix vancouverensis]|uniref:Uncharacterized protein n=1 Tax=Candidatus Nitrohelix vancouverensis TaxID=2705534 RepID=A0A7T0C3G4_9BACT|nr:MAG: hypothetical protein G3M78_10740 [Candidatus Nitrohelix vancouverensis]
MSLLKIRLLGTGLLLFGGALFVWSMRSIESEWPQLLTGLLSVLFAAIGFGILILPNDDDPSPPSP